ncbi:unnamed protein product [Penicillium palitans]
MSAAQTNRPKAHGPETKKSEIKHELALITSPQQQHSTQPAKYQVTWTFCYLIGEWLCREPGEAAYNDAEDAYDSFGDNEDDYPSREDR